MTGLPVINAVPARVESTTMAQRVVRALYDEIHLTPKPGLVDRANSGSHHDMDHELFMRSIAAIAPWFAVFHELGKTHAFLPEAVQLRLLRPAGIACEQAMFQATGGVNTHKGGIFALGLLCCAAGRLEAQGRKLSRQAVCHQVSLFCHGLVARELVQRNRQASTGERLFQQFGLAGARGEAESGFQTVTRYVLPGWQDEACEERRLHLALLRLMAVNPDTNLVSRGGLSGLRYVQRSARQVLAVRWTREQLHQMDQALIARHLSPGGSADLLSVAMVLAGLPEV